MESAADASPSSNPGFLQKSFRLCDIRKCKPISRLFGIDIHSACESCRGRVCSFSDTCEKCKAWSEADFVAYESRKRDNVRKRDHKRMSKAKARSVHSISPSSSQVSISSVKTLDASSGKVLNKPRHRPRSRSVSPVFEGFSYISESESAKRVAVPVISSDATPSKISRTDRSIVMGGLTSSVETYPTYSYKVGEVQSSAGLDFAGLAEPGVFAASTPSHRHEVDEEHIPCGSNITRLPNEPLSVSDQLSEGPRQQGGSEADHDDSDLDNMNNSYLNQSLNGVQFHNSRLKLELEQANLTISIYLAKINALSKENISLKQAMDSERLQNRPSLELALKQKSEEFQLVSDKFSELQNNNYSLNCKLETALADIGKYKDTISSLNERLDEYAEDLSAKDIVISNLNSLMDTYAKESEDWAAQVNDLRSRQCQWDKDRLSFIDREKRLKEELSTLRGNPKFLGNKTDNVNLVKNRKFVLESLSSRVISNPEARLTEIQNELAILKKDREDYLKSRVSSKHKDINDNIEGDSVVHSDIECNLSEDDHTIDEFDNDLKEGVNCIPETKEHNAKVFKQLRDIVVKLHPEYLQYEFSGNSATFLEEVMGVVKSQPRPLLNLSKAAMNSTNQFNSLLKKKRTIHTGKFRVFGSRFAKTSRRFYATCEQPQFKLPPLFRNICKSNSASSSKNPSSLYTYMSDTEIIRSLQSLHHIFEIASFLAWNLGAVAQHLRQVEILIGLKDDQGAVNGIKESLDFLASLGKANNSILSLIVTVFGNLLLKKRNALLMSLHPNVGVEFKNSLLYSDLSFEWMFPADLVKSIKDELDGFDLRDRNNSVVRSSKRARFFRGRGQSFRSGFFRSGRYSGARSSQSNSYRPRFRTRGGKGRGRGSTPHSSNQ
ncbi:MAG: hypothetical protein AAGM46_25535 [Cyanobacteria bacterium J06582_2]